jgi:hypothetical protein
VVNRGSRKLIVGSRATARYPCTPSPALEVSSACDLALRFLDGIVRDRMIGATSREKKWALDAGADSQGEKPADLPVL